MIFVNELIKAFCKRTTIAIFAVLLLLNGVLLYINETKQTLEYTPEQYKAAYQTLEGLDTHVAFERISQKKSELELIQRLSFGEDISQENCNAEELLKSYKTKSYLEFTDDIYSEIELTDRIYEEVAACENYDSYLENIDSTARKMTGISLFADPDSFSYKNIAQTPADFAYLKGSKLTAAPSKGISMATGFLATDLIAMLMIMTVVMTIVTREKELDQITLSRTTYKGRMPLGITKIFTCFAAAIVAEMLLYGVNFAVSYITYGFGDLSRQIQSVYEFNGSNLKISVLQYFALFLAAKLAVYCVFAAMIYLVTVVSNTAVKVYGILIITIAAEAVLYYTIPSTSYLCPLKYINILAYANTKDLFASYLNLNIFGKPVNYMAVFVGSAIVLLLILSILSVLIFSKQRVIKSRTRKFSLAKFSIFKGRTTNLFLQECYKVFIGGKALLILIAFAVITAVSYSPISESFSSADEVYYKQYMLKFEGEYTAEKQKMIDAEAQKFADAQMKMSEEMANSDGDGVFIMMKYQDILAPQYAFDEVTAGNKDLTLGLTAMRMVILCLTYVYAAEYQTGANVLLKTSARGREDTFLCKFGIGVVIVTMIFALTYAPYFYNVLNAYSTRGINAPACSIESLSNFDVSIKGYLILIIAGRYLALLCAMLIIYFLSAKLKSVISTFLAATAVLILPILLALLGIGFFDYVLLNPILIGNI